MNRTKRDRRATKNLPWQDGWLTVYRGKLPGESHKPNSTIFCASNGADRRLLYSAFSTRNYDEHGRLAQPSFIEELEARGYDIETLEFRIKRKATT
jgi:hypothetical protein